MDLLVGKYRLGRVLGEGGFGVVYAATNERLNQPVAIKLCKDRRGASRMQREARAAARLCSPHVVRIYDAEVSSDGTAFIVMERLYGQTVSARLRKQGVFEVNEAAEILCQVCDALAEAHACGLVHRDLKPSNLFLSELGADGLFVKVLDFGLVKAVEDASEQLTASDALLGSPSYMSPEQVRGERALGASTDIWALGVVLFELLTGAFPFDGDSRFAQLTAIVADPPRPLAELRPDLPAELQRIIAKCLRKDCRSRYSSVEQLAFDLAPFAGRARDRVRARVDELTRDDDAGERTALTLAPTEASPTLRVRVNQRPAWAPVLAAVVALLYMAASMSSGSEGAAGTSVRHGEGRGRVAAASAPSAAPLVVTPAFTAAANSAPHSGVAAHASVSTDLGELPPALLTASTPTLSARAGVEPPRAARPRRHELRPAHAASHPLGIRGAQPAIAVAAPVAQEPPSPGRAAAAAESPARELSARGAGLFLEPDF